MTQTELIRRHLDAGRTLTQLQASRAPFNCLRLAARIYDLRRAGYRVSSRIATRNGKRFAEYWRVRA